MAHKYLTRFIAGLLLTGCLLLTQRSHGSTVLAIDSLSTTQGPLNGANTGYGWASGWQVQNGSQTLPGYNIVTANPLTYPGISASGGYAIGGDAWQTAGRLLDTTTGGPFSTYLANSLIGAAGKTVTFGVLMRKDLDTDDEMSITLHAQSPPYWINTPGISVGHFGSASDTNGVRYWSLRIDGTVHQSTVPVVVGQSAFLVLQITFGATSKVSLYVNPSSSALPSTADAQASTTNSIAFQSVAFFGGSGANQSSIDEIRFAGSYSSLVSGTTPIPAAPKNMAVVAGNSSATISWSSVSGVSSYSIYQIVNGTTQLAGVINSSPFVDPNLANGTAYTFYAVASNGSQSSVASAQVTTVPHGPPPAPHPSLGTNLTQVADYNREWPFVDAMKTARPWIPQQQGSAWGQGPALALDSHGWITSLQSGQYAETVMFDNALNDHASYPTGQYIVLYDGSGTLSFDLQSATIVSQTTGRMVVNVPSGLNGIYLIESATDSSNPIRNIRFILPGFESTYQTQPFHPLFLQRLQGYGVVRFMEWMLTNNSTVAHWADRAQVKDYTYGWRGVPLEVLIQLANALGANPWFNIPAQANTTYVQQFATLVQQNLNSNLKFYVEYSNETWNTQFSQHAWMQAQGQSAGLSSDPTLSAAYYTAYRSVQIFNLIQSTIGSPNQMVRVIASQAANSWLSNQTLQFQNAYASADALAIAPYFNCDDTATGGFGVLGDPSTASQVDAMSISQVEQIQMNHINNCALQQMQSNAAVASSYGLKMVGYEGGQSLVGYNGAENDTAMTTLFGNVNRDSGMAPLYTQYLQNWVNSGGDVFVHYSDMGGYAKYGNFGTLEYQDQDTGSSPKYTALMAFSSQYQ